MTESDRIRVRYSIPETALLANISLPKCHEKLFIPGARVDERQAQDRRPRSGNTTPD